MRMSSMEPLKLSVPSHLDQMTALEKSYLVALASDHEDPAAVQLTYA